MLLRKPHDKIHSVLEDNPTEVGSVLIELMGIELTEKELWRLWQDSVPRAHAVRS